MFRLRLLGLASCCFLIGCENCKPKLTPIAKNDTRSPREREQERMRNPDGRGVGNLGAENLGRNDRKPNGLEQGLGGAKIGFPIPITKDG